jgi:small-conductance mechanosensitive channel
MNITDIMNLIPYSTEIKNVLDQSGFGSHILGFLIFLGFIVIARGFIFVYEKYLLKLVDKTENGLDDQLIKGMRKPVFFGLLFLGVYFGSKVVEFPVSIEGYVDKFVLSLVVIFLVILASKFVDFIICNWLKSIVENSDTKLDDIGLPLLHKVVGIFFFVIALAFILDIWGVQVGPLLASIGIVGIALGFALKDSLANIFGGFSLIVDRAFRVGDFIKIDKETKGKVIDIGLRSTKIRTVDNHVVVLPNGDLSNKKLINYAKISPETRISIPVRVEYGSKVDDVKKVLLDCVKVVDEGILNVDKTPKVYFTNMGDFGMEFKLIVPITNYKKRFVNAEKLRVKVYENLNKYKIKIPYPTYNVKRS